MRDYCRVLVLLTVVFWTSSCSPKYKHFASLKDESISIDSIIEKYDASTDNIIAPFRLKMQGEMNEVIATSETDLIKLRPEHTMGNFATDAMLNIAQKFEPKADFALLNYGGLRIPSLPKGSITRGNIFEMMPFENSLNICQLDSSLLYQLLDIVAYDGGWPVSKNFNMTIDQNRPTNIMINGKPLSNDRKYFVVLPDYVKNGGENAFFLKDAPCKDYNTMIRYVLIDYLKSLTANNQVLTQKIEGRIVLQNK